MFEIGPGDTVEEGTGQESLTTCFLIESSLKCPNLKWKFEVLDN